ncbi:hypothetical protein [Spiroplasma endosymbiont of Amphibalanus improvisus]|uniref:hypothetical protein n=1 Tax=Spiroplasma endosymbiont of Amphibalanus improvisus TaxID=3066327 RepID=UPI00313F12BB
MNKSNKFQLNIHKLYLFSLLVFSILLSFAYGFLFIYFKILSPSPKIYEENNGEILDYHFQINPKDLSNSISFYQNDYYFDINILKYDIAKEIASVPLPIENVRCEFYFSEILNSTYTKESNIIFWNEENIIKKILLSL